MHGALDGTVAVDDPMHFEQLLKAALHREIRELPLNDAGKPDKGAHVEKANGAEGFVFLKDAKARISKRLPLLPQIEVGKGLRRLREDHFHQLPIVVLSHLLCDEQSAPS